MKRIVLTYGLVSGAIVIASVILGIFLQDGSDSLASLEYLGYLVMLVALSVIFIGIKRYRDHELGGVITFGTAALVGLGISLVASVVYVVVWEIYLSQTDYAFIDDYIASSIAAQEAGGLTGVELEAFVAEMDDTRVQYAKTAFRLAITFMEIFPVGLLITLISAAFLRKSENLPATQ